MDFPGDFSLLRARRRRYSTSAVHLTCAVSNRSLPNESHPRPRLSAGKNSSSQDSRKHSMPERSTTSISSYVYSVYSFSVSVIPLALHTSSSIVLSTDSIRELRKHGLYENKDIATPQAEAHAHMKQFRSQRNFYIAGFALFLWL